MATQNKTRFPFLNKLIEALPSLRKSSSATIPFIKNNAHRPSQWVIPLQLQRIKQDIESWRLAVDEAENAYFPLRVKMQQLYVDKVLEGHSYACMQRRKNLTLLKEFKIGRRDKDGKWVENAEASQLFNNKKWFKDLLNHILDAQFYGYSLIQLGDLKIVNRDYGFENLTIIKRWHVSPDRYQLVRIPQQYWGLNFMDESAVDDAGAPFADWMIYVPTPSDNGSSVCGYGLLYNVALYGIYLRNNLSDNATYNELFATPTRHIKTNAEYGSDEYNKLEQFMQAQAALAYLITGMEEQVEFVNGNTGTGYQSYADLEKRCQQAISKIILGHADALDSKNTALGGGVGGKKSIDEDNTPEGKALIETEKTQDDFALNVLNDIVKAKLIKLKFPLNDEDCFYLTNDKEEFDTRKKKDAANLVTAQVWQTAKNGGLKLSAETFTEITGIPAEEVEEQQNYGGFNFGAHKKLSARMKNKLNSIYKVPGK